MRSLVLCYASEDDHFARRLGGYLEANLPLNVSYGECVVRPDFDLVDAAERGLSAEVALVLLSPNSVPQSWNRQKWEPVFFAKPAEFGTLLGFVLLADCKFPELIRREHFFDARSDFLNEARRIRRWLLRPEQPVTSDTPAESPLLEILDRPGVMEDVPHADAVEFAAARQSDFEAVCTFDCQGRSRAGILGDMGHTLGIKLPGTIEENREKLHARSVDHRCLYVIANARPADRSFLDLAGRASVIFTSDSPVRKHASTEDIAAAFLDAPRDDAKCADLLGDAIVRMAECLATDFELGLRFGWAIVSVLRAAERFAEAVEVLDAMEQAARDRDDTLALYRIEWEQSWLRESSGAGEPICILPTAGPEVAQLSLFG